jgi:BlaI family transcriptional regulator, penicillinase repressor
MRKPAARRDIPPPLELECLKALWGLGEGRVKDVRQVMIGNRKLAYTTVMTVLDRLEKRGGVVRRKHGRCFVYIPKVSKEAMRRHAVKELVDGFFDGSPEALARFLEGNAPLPAVAKTTEPISESGIETVLL